VLTITALALVTILGLIVAALSLWGIAQPARLIRFVQIVMAERYGIWVAVLVRLLLGAAMIVCAPASRYPTSFTVLGWIAVIAAIGLALVGRDGMRRIVTWIDRFPPWLVRLALLVGLVFGLFLVNGALAGV
jgi:hypothetical protein